MSYGNNFNRISQIISDTLRKVSKVHEAVQHSCFFAQPRRLRSRRKLVKFVNNQLILEDLQFV